MNAIAVLRAAWRGALALTPAPLLRALDDWSRRQAARKAEERRLRSLQVRASRRS